MALELGLIAYAQALLRASWSKAFACKMLLDLALSAPYCVLFDV